MPNHITNIIELDGDREEIEKLLETVKADRYGIGTIDFNKLIPMPRSLDIEEGSRTRRGLKAYEDFVSVYKILNGEKSDLLNIPEKAEKAFLQHRKDVEADEWKLGKAAFRNIMQYGCSTWYNWCVSNWGTKWNAYGYEEGGDYSKEEKLTFLTAWAAPHPVIAKLSEMFPEVDITHEWADEDIGMHCGRYVYQDGERCEEYYPESDVDRIEFAARVIGTEPSDYGLFINASGTEYIRYPDEEFEKIEVVGQPALFTNARITDRDIPKGFYCYHLRGSDDSGSFATIEKTVGVDHSGSVITLKPIDLGEKGYISFDEDSSPNFLGESCLLEEFGDELGADETDDIEQSM